MPILSLVIFSPLAGVLLLLFVPRDALNLARWVALLSSVITFLVSLPLFFWFETGTANFQFVEHAPWIASWGVDYFVALDGVSLPLVLLTTLLTVLAIVASWHGITHHVREFMLALLLLEVGINGVFLAMDMFLFFVFWEVMLFPMYFLIGVWGSERRLYAAIKFVVYTMSASALMLAAILSMYFLNYRMSGELSFSILEWYRLNLELPLQYWLFAAFALAFAVKIPLFPFHTWLPDAHVQAPTAGSVMLAGILLKMGVYGFIRFAIPLFPEAFHESFTLLMLLSLAGILYGALVCVVQSDLKKLVAYSSVSHLGFVMLGLFALNPTGVSGSIVQMINHGITTGALFLLVGMLYERRHTKQIAEFGGLIKVMPIYASIFLVVTLASIGLPGLNGFIGEYLIVLGAFQAWPTVAVLAVLAVILAAIYMLWAYQRVFFGQITNKANLQLRDLPLRESVVMLPLLVLIVLLGIYPAPLLKRIEPSVTQFIHLSKGEQRPLAIDWHPQTHTVSLRYAPAADDDDDATAAQQPRHTSLHHASAAPHNTPLTDEPTRQTH